MQLFGTVSWEIALPNGLYRVRVVAGDPVWYNSVYAIDVEGVLAVAGTPSSAKPWFEGTRDVSLSDGRLTVRSAEGASNNKIDFVEIETLSTTNSPLAPVITEPGSDGQIVHPADVHMATGAFSDPNGDGHSCTDWEIRVASTSELVWVSPCNSSQLVHVHLGDGSFVNSYAGRSELAYSTEYRLRVRAKDASGDPASEWSPWSERIFRTATAPASGSSVPWTVRQSGYVVEVVAGGFQLPVNIAFVPSPGSDSSSPYFYVSELYGNIKVVARDGTSSDYIRGVLNYRPSGVFPGDGEQGLTGLAVDPVSGDVFASMLYEAYPGGPHYPKIVRFHSNHGGSVAGNYATILDMYGETQGASHQISNLSIGRDGKLYAHNGDGFAPATAQNLASYRGKILRMNLDGTAAVDNPFYDVTDGITAKDYVWASGFRNPFGGDWRHEDGAHYAVENGPSVDRFAKIVSGRNYLWDGTDASMRNYALHNWSPAVAPVNLAFIQPGTFGGSRFPLDKMGHAFVSESGATWATGPQTYGKRISEFVLDATGKLVTGPANLVDYTGTGKATVAGLAAGPDGLYFTDLYKDLNFSSPTDAGANVLRVRYVGAGAPNTAPSVSITSPANGSSFTAPASIAINASAADSDGAISTVEFFSGSTKLGEDTSAPYSFSWSNVSAGTYTLTARATDNAGSTATSTEVSVTVRAAVSAGVSIAASPSSRNVRRGGETTYTITLTPSGGFTGSLDLSVTGLPAGVGASFSPDPVSITSTASVSSRMTVTATPTAGLGTFTLTVTATAATLEPSTRVSLNIRK